MKILIISQYFWPEAFRINELAANLVERGNHVTVLAGIPNYPDGQFFKDYSVFKPFKETYKGIKIIRSPLISRGASKGIRLVLNYLSFAFFATLTGLLFCREKYDVILVYQPSPVTVGIPAVIMRMLKKIPVLFWVQDLWPESLSATGAIKNAVILRAIAHMVKWIYRHCDLILIPSRAFKPQIERFGVNPAKIVYLPNSAEQIYQPVKLSGDAPEIKLMPNGGFKVMFAGNIGAAQDFETILSAAEKLKYSNKIIHWLVLGDGRMRPWVEAEVKRREIQNCFHLLGKFPVERMANFFSLADVMLVTLKNSPIFSMTIPAKVQSYLACAKPVISAVGGEGNAVIEEAQAGIACPPEDADALAQAVLKMYEMRESERQQLGTNGRNYFMANFDSVHLINKLETLMNEIPI
ncbi:MAG: glycosyltransferase family 4 protein [Deltaproteobacteria bacterium]|nr:glycosyltransferase family 4 protein [Deltaproteobacteria bacterium]